MCVRARCALAPCAPVKSDVRPHKVLGLHRRRIFKIGSMLRSLERNLADLQLLLDLQLEILAALKATERAIALSRSRLRDQKRALKVHRLPKPEARKLKALIHSREARLDHYKWLLSIWRTFGDGIAFLYLDKWAIKPLLYNIHDPNTKDHAGSILGKPGLANELKILRGIIRSGVPALLNDLTNCIRHGDICVLAADDPMLIEVKSSANTDARTQRQLDNIKSIHEYHRTDQGRNVRGAPLLHRVALSRREAHYRNLFDEGIATALKVGHFLAEPEFGLRFVCTTTGSKKVLDRLLLDFVPSAAYYLNQFKNENAWGVYFPYVLSIRSLENLYAFLDGTVSLIVLFDFNALRVAARKRNLALSETSDATWPVQIDWLKNMHPEPALARLSSHFLGRMACELLSWNWVLSEERRRFIGFEREGRPSVA